VQYWGNVECTLTNRDTGPYGQLVVDAIVAGGKLRNNFDWRLRPTLSLTDVESRVDHGHDRYGLYIPESFSAKINDAINPIINSIGSSFIYDNKIISVIDEGRNNILAGSLRAAVAEFLRDANHKLGPIVLTALGSNVSVTALGNKAIFGAVAVLEETTLHRIPRNGLVFGTGFVFVMLFIFSIIFAHAFPAINQFATQRVWMTDVMVVRIAEGLLIPLFFAFVPATVMVVSASQPEDDLFCRNYGAYWALCWLVLCVYVALVILFVYLGEIGAPLMSLFIVTNVATSDILVPIIISPDFYRLGYALPMHNAVAAARNIVFCSHTDMGRNIGVLIAWLVAAKLGTYALFFRHQTGIAVVEQRLIRNALKERESAATTGAAS